MTNKNTETEASIREKRLILQASLKEAQNSKNGFAVVTEVAILSKLEELAKEAQNIANEKNQT